MTGYERKTIMLYDGMDVPLSMRLVSEKLCMDFTSNPRLSQNPLDFQEINELSKSALYDHVYVEFEEGTAYIWVPDENGESFLSPLDGVFDLKDFDIQDYQQLPFALRRIRTRK